MPTPVRPFRRMEILSAAGKILVGAVLLCFPLFVEVDETGLWIGLGLSAFFVPIGLWDLRAARRIDPEGVVVTLDDLPPAEQAAYFRRTMWIIGVLVPLVAAHHAHELRRLETGAVPEVTLVVPVGLVYRNFGYWPAVSVLPALTAAGLIALAVRLRRANRTLNEADDGAAADELDALLGPDAEERRKAGGEA